jgi:type II secretory pathway pseudopilin PulG
MRRPCVHHQRGQRGETLLELLLTVAIMGTAFTGILAGVGMTFSASNSHRQQATGEAAVRSYAERMKDPTGMVYVNCAVPANYSATPNGFSLPAAGWTATVTSVLAWQGDTPPTFGACSTDKGLQQLTLQVQSPAGVQRATEVVVIVKRKP